MLDTLRANSRSVLTYVLFAIIIVVFVVQFGPGSKGCGAAGHVETWAAKVNGKTVPPSAFEKYYGRYLQFYRAQGMNELDALTAARIRTLAMEQAIQDVLLSQEAERRGIVATDDELAKAIEASPQFQRDGQFDRDGYLKWAKTQPGGEGGFEEGLRQDLIRQKLVVLVSTAAKVSPEEVRQAYFTDGDRAALEFARFPIGLAKLEVKATEAQVQDYLAKHAAEVDQVYKDNPARFDRKERVHARHILVAVPEDADQAAQDAAKQKIDELAARLKKGEDFAKVAQEGSDDPGSKNRGGDLDFFGRGQMAKPFEDAAFALKPNEISAPVRTQFGWHLIQVLAVEAPEKLTLEKARPLIAREQLEAQLARQLATQRAADVLKKLQSGKTLAMIFLDKAAEVKLGNVALRPQETGPFVASAAPNVPVIGPAPDLFEDAMKATAGQVLPKVYDTPSGPVVARVKERERPDPAQFEARKAEVESRLRVRRESEVQRTWFDDLQKRSKIVKNERLLAGGSARAPEPLD